MKRSNLIAAGAAGAVVLVLVGILWYFHDRRFDVVITQETIDAALQERFPVTNNHLLIFQITYSNPHATLLPGANRIEIGLDADMVVKLGKEPKKFSGTALVTTGLSYRSETHQFFLADPEINKLAIQGIPQQYLDKVTPHASNFARDHLQQFPIYTLKARNAKMMAVKLLLKDVQVKNNELHATLGL